MRRMGGFDRVEHCARRLDAIGSLTPEARLAILNLDASPRKHAPGQTLNDPDAPQDMAVLLAGWACRHRILSGGRRHIFDVLLPGDFIAPRPLGWDAHCLTTTLTDCVTLPAAELSSRPELQGVLRRARLQEDQRLLANSARLGRTSARERVADFFCDLYERLAVVGLAFGDKIAAPLTQETLAEILALSQVHLNRTLRELRKAKVLELHSGWATFFDHPLLQKLALGDGYVSPALRRPDNDHHTPPHERVARQPRLL